MPLLFTEKTISEFLGKKTLSSTKPSVYGRMAEQGFIHLVQKSWVALAEGKRKEEIRKRKAVDQINGNEFREAA